MKASPSSQGREDDALARIMDRMKPALYSGKWTLEEETYVAFLCEEFRAGSLPFLKAKACVVSWQTNWAVMPNASPKSTRELVTTESFSTLTAESP